MHHQDQHYKIRLVGVVTIAMLVGLLAGGRGAHGQSLDDSSAPASDSSLAERAIPPGVESPTIDTPDAPAVSDDAITTNDTDDSAASPVSANSDTEYAPSGGAVGSDEASGSNSENSAVLELPQVVNLPNGSTANASADEASANPDGNDDDTAQSSQDGEDNVGDHDLAAMAGQVGTLEDYQDQANEAPPPGVIVFAPVTVVGLPRPPLFNSLPRPLFGAPMATSPIILPPTSSGPFPSTSPMLMGRRFGAFGSFPRVGSFPHGGFMGAHR
jgi:hypothetical protein